MKYLTSMELSEKWGVSKRYVNYLCKNGKIEGAKKDGYRWLIPETAIVDSYCHKMEAAQKQEALVVREGGWPMKYTLPIGVSDYRLACTEYYYVDKTLLIQELLDHQPLVSLFTRPRRFGKTLNMDMLRVFFEKTTEDTSVFFQHTNIWKAGEKYREKQGKYPVIFLTFKDIKYNTWEDTRINLQAVLQSEFRRHQELLEGDKLSQIDKRYVEKVLSGELEDALWPSTLEQLSRLLDDYYGIPPIIMIDEYDTPIQQGHLKDFYEEAITFMRNLLSGGLKDNRHLTMAFLTGILRVAKESIFSGLNNLNVNSILEQRYRQYFGFTESEVQQMLSDFHKVEKYKEVKLWYDGYLFGTESMFNPWSVLNYISGGFLPKTYWQSTGSNDIIGEIIAESSQEQIEEMQTLLQGNMVDTYVDTSVVYPSIKDNPSSVYSFLLMAGYLTVCEKQELYDGNSLCKVKIPNREILYVYEKEIINRWSNIVSLRVTIGIQQALLTGNTEKLQKELERFLLESVSYYDAATEGFFHGMLLGMSAVFHGHYHITSNLESGNGRYDIQLEPVNKSDPAFLIEVKAAKEKEMQEGQISEQLNVLASQAFDQIQNKKYETALVSRGCKIIRKIGIAFYKKQCAVTRQQQ